ncbi:MAG: hypothetical protein IJX38_01910 [Clostridia bacterium]|nr:hypothetical protein [Clostridia bacterium]
MSKDKKKKKQKVKYIDDGRTIADMSALYGRRGEPLKKRASFKEQSATFFGAMKMMFIPMLVVIGILSVAFGITYLLMISGG